MSRIDAARKSIERQIRKLGIPVFRFAPKLPIKRATLQYTPNDNSARKEKP